MVKELAELRGLFSFSLPSLPFSGNRSGNVIKGQCEIDFHFLFSSLYFLSSPQGVEDNGRKELKYSLLSFLFFRLFFWGGFSPPFPQLKGGRKPPSPPSFFSLLKWSN